MMTLDLPSAPQHKINLTHLRPFLTRARKAVPLAGEVSILLTSDKNIQTLNRSWRKKNKPTDVLSFPAADFPDHIAGDIAISLDTAARQARRFGHPLQIEIKILMLHGLLHLAGYDHETDRGQMAQREDELRRRFRLPPTLISRTKPTPRKQATR